MAAISTSSAFGAVPAEMGNDLNRAVQAPTRSQPFGAARSPLRLSPAPDWRTTRAFRLIVRRNLWGRQVRLRFSNALGAPQYRPPIQGRAGNPCAPRRRGAKTAIE